MKDFRIEDGKSVRKVEWERKIDWGKGEKGVNEKEWERMHRELKREGEEREMCSQSRQSVPLTLFVLPDPSQSRAGNKTVNIVSLLSFLCPTEAIVLWDLILWSRVRVQTNSIDRHAGVPWKKIQAVQQREFRRFHEGARYVWIDNIYVSKLLQLCSKNVIHN